MPVRTQYGLSTDAMDIKVYANKEIQEGLKAQGHSKEDVQEKFRDLMLVLAGLRTTAVTTDATTDAVLEERVEKLEEIVEQIQIQIDDWKRQ